MTRPSVGCLPRYGPRPRPRLPRLCGGYLARCPAGGSRVARPAYRPADDPELPYQKVSSSNRAWTAARGPACPGRAGAAVLGAACCAVAVSSAPAGRGRGNPGLLWRSEEGVVFGSDPTPASFIRTACPSLGGLGVAASREQYRALRTPTTLTSM